MENTMDFLEFDVESRIAKLIKVIGVGGAGCNAVNHMYNKNILSNVDYIVCNTDIQSLHASPVPHKIQIGKNLTKGLGAGSKPDTGKNAVLENMDEIRRVLSQETKMLYITAGMGGGTGTGAAPEIAKVAREMGILTVGIVTMPFEYEGKKRREDALKGIAEMRKHVDSLIIINNEKLIEVYGDLAWNKAFEKSDEVLANAVLSVNKVITENYTINVDFNDVETILRDSGTALIGTAQASGEKRAEEVVKKALHSPLLNDNRIEGAKNVLLLILSDEQGVTVREIKLINEYIRRQANNDVNIILGLGMQKGLGEDIGLTVIATGFPPEQQEKIQEHTQEIIRSVDDGKTIFKVNDDTPEINDVPRRPLEETGNEEIRFVDFEESHNEDDNPEKPDEEDDYRTEWEKFFEFRKTKRQEQEVENTGFQPEPPKQDKKEEVIISLEDKDNEHPEELDLFDMLPEDSRADSGKDQTEFLDLQEEDVVEERVISVGSDDDDDNVMRFRHMQAEMQGETFGESGERRHKIMQPVKVEIMKESESSPETDWSFLNKYTYQFTFENDRREPTARFVNLKRNTPELDSGDSYLNPKLD